MDRAGKHKDDAPPGLHADDIPSGKTIEGCEGTRLGRYSLVLLLLLIAVIFFHIIKVFLVPVVVAASFATLFFPLYRWLLRSFRDRKNVSAFVCCLLLLVCLIVPLYFLADQVARQTVELYNVTEPWIRDILDRGDDGLLGRIKRHPIARWFGVDSIDWQSSLRSGIKAAGSLMTNVINKTSQSVFQLVTSLLVVFFTMFYFFRDGERFVERIGYMSPLPHEYEKMVFSRFVMISRATVKGTLLIGLIQGAIGAVTLLVFGFRSWLVLGVVMIILSIVPMVGAWLVMIPVAIVEIATGSVWQGIIILLITVLIISSVDNLLRPRLVGREAHMHELIVFFSTVGGIGVFGVMGFIVGPVVAALFMAILDIWCREFRPQLESAENR